VFKLTPDGTETVLYSFTGGSDGLAPLAGLIADAAGNLYGTTEISGGVFKLSPPGPECTPVSPNLWCETVLHSFCSKPNCSDGVTPYGALIADAKGNLFSTTASGGASNAGTVFRLSPDGTETVLYSFCSKPSCSDGAFPFAGLLGDSAGNLYGTTEYGGGLGCGSGCGVVFKLSPPGPGCTPVSPNLWCETVLHSFANSPSDGANPVAGLIADSKGNLFGTTLGGGDSEYGVVFELTGTGFAVFAGTPGMSSCQGKSVSALAKQYGGLDAAAAALGYPSVAALQNAIKAWCAG
jgi:uncharacterized repeat protein (TIGR03803 family)